MKHASNSKHRTNSGLYTVGLLTACVYAITFLFYRKGPQSHGSWAKEIFAWFICLLLLFLFWQGYQVVRRSSEISDLNFEISPRLVVGFGVLFCFLACLIFPFNSTDAFGYINRGWVQVHYHQNPYVQVVADIPEWRRDPMLWEHWIQNPSPYGFLFALLTRFLCWVGNGNWALTLALFKTLNALGYGFGSWLMWAIAKRLGHAKPVATLYLMMWNPLILMHQIANGHNDILTGCLLLAAMYLALVGAGLWIIPVLVAATLLKYGPMILIPLAIVFVTKNHGWKVTLLSCLIGAAVLSLAAAPYVHDWRQFRIREMALNALLVDNSVHALFIHSFDYLAKFIPPLAGFHELVNWLIKNILRGGFAVFLIGQLLTTPKNYSPGSFARKSLLIMFVLICVASSKYYAWYLGMILPLALVLDEDDWLRQLVLFISGAQLFSLTSLKRPYILYVLSMLVVPAWVIFRKRREARNALVCDFPD